MTCNIGEVCCVIEPAPSIFQNICQGGCHYSPFDRQPHRTYKHDRKPEVLFQFLNYIWKKQCAIFKGNHSEKMTCMVGSNFRKVNRMRSDGYFELFLLWTKINEARQFLNLFPNFGNCINNGMFNNKTGY